MTCAVHTCFADSDKNDPVLDKSRRTCGNPRTEVVDRNRGKKLRSTENDEIPSGNCRDIRGKTCGDSHTIAESRRFQGAHMYQGSSSLQAPAPAAWTYVALPTGQSSPDLFSMLSGMPQVPYSNTWRGLSGHPVPHLSSTLPVTDKYGSQEMATENVNINESSRSSSIKVESEKRKFRRANKREAEEEASRRERLGLKPYVVQVRPSGIIDSGCKGHLKWQEYIRDLTPRMLDMSVMKYEDQNESSRDKLWDAFYNKFEFLEHDVSQASFDKMIKTWIRRDRERVRRLHGDKIEAPTNYSSPSWDALRKYWDSPEYKAKSEKMSETRRRVVYHPRVGRDGYAGKEAKLVRV